MPTSRTPAAERLRSVGAFGLVGVGLSLTYRFTGWGLPCPWRMLTGTLCPLCGATHMGSDLLSLDFAAAWSHNAFVLSWGLILGLFAAFWAVEALGGPAVRRVRVLQRPAVWWAALGLTALAFTIVRNL